MQTDSLLEQQARNERSARLQQDAARTLGERAKYFVVEGNAIARKQVNIQIEFSSH